MKPDVSSELWRYGYDVRRLEVLRRELSGLMSVRGHSYEAHSVNGVSDPVNEVVHRRLKVEKRISRIEERVLRVERLKEYLPLEGTETYQMREIVRLRYRMHERVVDVMRKMGITKTTYWRRNRELLRLADKYLG